MIDAVAGVDLVLDCSDNMETRHQVNAACIKAHKPLISGSAVGFSGQLLVVMTALFPWLLCLSLSRQRTATTRNCRTAGVLGPVVGVIGTLQRTRSHQNVGGLPSPLSGKLRLFDGKQQSWSTLQLTRAAHCPACGGGL